MKVFCIHFAGGNKYSFRSFQEKAPNGIELISLELPGRGSRPKEALLRSMDEAVNDLYEQVKDQLTDPYIIYGHSMGSWLGFLLTHKIRKEGKLLPVQLMLTGRRGPAFKKDGGSHTYLLPKSAFIDRLKSYGGIPDLLLNEPALLDYFLPIIRADFEIIGTYEHQPLLPLAIPMTVVIGEEELITDEEAMAWQQETTAAFDYMKLPGNHFFIFGQEEALFELMTSKMLTI